MIGLSQFIPQLKVGFLITYIAPLAFVLCITLFKEAFDDFQRKRKDLELNNKKYEKLKKDGTFKKTNGANIAVGDIIKVYQNERIPADMVLLQTTEKSGSVFIRTDQLDGETDWKLRKAITLTQNLAVHQRLVEFVGEIVANPPNDQIYDFKGYFESNTSSRPNQIIEGESLSSPGNDAELLKNDTQREALSLESTMWANTVLASSGHVLGMVVYTGVESRAQMNSRDSQTKIGKLDLEINLMSKYLFVAMLILSFCIVAL